MRSFREFFDTKKNRYMLNQLYEPHEAEIRAKEFAERKMRICLLTVVVTTVFFAFAFFYEKKISETKVVDISRDNHSGELITKDTKVVLEGKTERETFEMDISVNPQKYTEDELARLAAEAEPIIWETVCGENDSLDNVTNNLNFAESIPGYPFKITWKSERPTLLNSKGRIDFDNLSEILDEIGDAKGVSLQICATLTSGDYVEDLYSYVSIFPKKLSYEEELKQKLQTAISEADRKSQYEKEFRLPAEIEGYKVSFFYLNDHKAVVIVFMGIVISIILVRLKDSELKEKVKEREKEMERDYPRILNQYALFYTAGMNTRMIWRTIVENYEERLKNGGKARYAFEEMKRVEQRMRDGMGELDAYRFFSARCTNNRYKTFASTISQALQKGRGNLGALLIEEAERAERENDNRVRSDVQEMGTKLLAPMFMMFIIVLVIVMYPAFSKLYV